MLDTILPKTEVKINKRQDQSEPTREFTYSEWKVMKNGMEVYLLGYTGKQLRDAVSQWPKSLHESFWIGWNVQKNVMNREGVAYALYQRFAGEE